jgi:hypothetical protein
MSSSSWMRDQWPQVSVGNLGMAAPQERRPGTVNSKSSVEDLDLGSEIRCLFDSWTRIQDPE